MLKSILALGLFMGKDGDGIDRYVWSEFWRLLRLHGLFFKPTESIK